MKDYARVFEISNEWEINDYLSNGWELIDTYKVGGYEDDDGERIGYMMYVLGLSHKELSNKLMGVIKEYEKYGLKDVLLNKVADEMNDRVDDYIMPGSFRDVTPLSTYMTNYETVVNNKYVTYSKKSQHDDTDLDDMPF